MRKGLPAGGLPGATTLRRDGLPADEGRKPVVLPKLGARATLDNEVILRVAWGWREATAFHLVTESRPRNRIGAGRRLSTLDCGGLGSRKRVLRRTDGSRVARAEDVMERPPTRPERLSDEAARVQARCPNLRPADVLTIAETISY